jgi:tRNA(Arg) A34 adenosine deaminase TadA
MTRRRPARFTQRDMTRAVRAVAAAGMPVAQVMVDKDGRIVVTVGEARKAAADNPLDQWMAGHARAAQRD